MSLTMVLLENGLLRKFRESMDTTFPVCISWIYSPDGEFWRKVVLSGKKLRDKFDQMNIQAISKVPTKQELELSEMAQSFANVLRKKGVADDEILRQLRAEGLVA